MEGKLIHSKSNNPSCSQLYPAGSERVNTAKELPAPAAAAAGGRGAQEARGRPRQVHTPWCPTPYPQQGFPAPTAPTPSQQRPGQGAGQAQSGSRYVCTNTVSRMCYRFVCHTVYLGAIEEPNKWWVQSTLPKLKSIGTKEIAST